MSIVSNPLVAKYDEFLELLQALCEYYDRDEKEILALPISTSIRVLVHDTRRSTSLLTHLGKKDAKYISTNTSSDRDPVHLGIVRRIHVGVKDGVGGEAKYWPLCDERYFEKPQECNELKFSEWWEKEVVFRSNEHSLTRKDIILSVANKDGGAHFDSEVEEKYDAFRHSWSGGSTLVGINSGIRRGYDNVPTFPAIRQIAYELLSTIKSNSNKVLDSIGTSYAGPDRVSKTLGKKNNDSLFHLRHTKNRNKSSVRGA